LWFYRSSVGFSRAGLENGVKWTGEQSKVEGVGGSIEMPQTPRDPEMWEDGLRVTLPDLEKKQNFLLLPQEGHRGGKGRN